MSDQNLDYAAIRRNIEKGIHRQKQMYRLIFFGTHLVFFVVSMLAIWGTVLVDSQLRDILFNSGSAAWVAVVLPTILWATMILCHVAALFTESGVAEKSIRERLLMREVGEEILRKGLMDEGLSEKPKRRAAAMEARRVLLSDDGELIAEDEDEHREQRGFNTRTNSAGDP